MSRRYPPLNPLRVFVVVARLENLTAAAQELHVSQSAVSRQIAALESYLGIELLRRERHGVTLTRAGANYAKRVMPAFDEIATATEKVLRDTSHGVLRVRTYTTFTAKWLIPRLPDFHARYPDIEVLVSNAVPDVDFDRDAVDLAIQFGDGHWPRVQLDLLFPDEIEPVCSPQYLKSLPRGATKDVLLGKRLLVSHYRRTDWDDWLSATGKTQAAVSAERMSFSTSVLTWQAALDGLGMAIGQSAMLQAEFEKGTLIRPFNQPLRREKAHYLVRPASQRFSRRVEVFRGWLLAEAAKVVD
ncbi:transcriptional regulator GcvA [Variovorax defluvii]|uniref:Transcriptional regulator GcvA n=1 Tax=Variovorax defluvii TaxID=913761 RepID=A0ABP8HE19_9BURK